MATTNDSVRNKLSASSESTGGLLSRLLDDATALVRNEIALAKAELQQAVGAFKTAAASMGMGAVVLFGGLQALLAGAILALSMALEPWLAALLIGAALTVIGIVMLMSARKRLTATPTHLDHTQKALRADAAVVARRT